MFHSWVDAYLPGAEPTVTDEPYIVGQSIAGYVLPRGIPLETTPSTVVVKLASNNAVLSEVSTAPGGSQYRVLYDPNQPLGGAIQFNAAQAGLMVKVTYKNAGDALWARDAERMELGALGGGLVGRQEVYGIGGILGWYEAGRQFNDLPGGVTGYQDFSGNDRNGDNGTGGTSLGERRVGVSGLSGDGAWRLSATSNHGARFNGLAANNPSTVIVVYAPLTTASSDYRVLIGQSNVLIGPYLGAYNFHNSGFIAGPALVAGQFKTSMMIVDGAGTRAYLDNALVGSNGTTTGWGSNLYLAYNTSGAAAVANANSDVALILAFNKALSAHEANLVHAYIKGRFRLNYALRAS